MWKSFPLCLLCPSGTSIVFDMGLTYILVALVAVILNNVLVEMLSLHTRITVGECVYLENKGMGEEAVD